MRGSPIFQALLVMLLLAVLGFVGRHFIQGGKLNEAVQVKSTSENTEKLTAEIEIYFSENPKRYVLRRPGNGSDKGEHILTVENIDENPVWHDIELLNNKDDTLWLDVTWPNTKEQGRYFVQVYVTVGDSDPQKFTFHDNTLLLEGVMELKMPSNTGNQ